MKNIYLILIILFVLSSCKKGNDQNMNSDDIIILENLQIRWDDPYQNAKEYDTIVVLVHMKQYAIAEILDNSGFPIPQEEYVKYSFEWSINNETTYTSRYIHHIFQSNGIKEISLTVNYLEEEKVFIFYTNVYGFLINDVDKESYGFFIDESENFTRTVFTREDNDMIGYEFNNYELVSRKVLDQGTINSLEIVDFSKDKNGNLNLWTWNTFYKFDKHANTLLTEDTFIGYAGSIYISTENEYFLVGTSSYRTKFIHFDQNGGNSGQTTLHESDENLISKDGLMVNDSTYILLINNTDNNETSLIQKHLNSYHENTLIIFSDNYHRIIKTDEGYITYEIGEEGIAYLDQNLELVWNMEVNPYFKWERMRLREFQNSFLIINRNQLISISKSGELNFIKDYYDDWRFTFKSISESSNNALILADIYNHVPLEDGNNATLMFIIDENGNIVE